MDLAERESEAVAKLHEVAAAITPSPEDIERRARRERRPATGALLAAAALVLAAAALAGAGTFSRAGQGIVVDPSLDPAGSLSDPVPDRSEDAKGSTLLVRALASLEPTITSNPVPVVPVDLPTGWKFGTVSGTDAYSINMDFLDLMSPPDATQEIPTVYTCTAPRSESGAVHERCAAPEGEIAQRIELDDSRVEAVLIGTPEELAPWRRIRFTTELPEVNW